MNNETFTAQVEDTDIWGINEFLGVSKDFDIETGKPTLYVDYELEPEAREWGIKTIYVHIRKIAASIEWYVVPDDLTEDQKAELIKAGGTEYNNGNIEGVIEIDTSIKEMDITNEATFADDGRFTFDNCEIDLKKNTITLS